MSGGPRRQRRSECVFICVCARVFLCVGRRAAGPLDEVEREWRFEVVMLGRAGDGGREARRGWGRGAVTYPLALLKMNQN